jgi:NTP pyrophosphatase (non-canonical NTP hydrolase)
MKDLQAEIKKFLADRGWDNLRPSDLAKSVSIEAAELLELFQWSNQELEKVKQDREKVDEIKKELADVMIYCLQLATLLELDAKEIIAAKLKRASEKYPPEIMRAQAGIEPGTEKEYFRIKKEYRRSGQS